MRFVRPVAVVLAVVLALATVGAAGISAATSTAAAPEVVAICASTKNGGYVRLLEAKNVVKSRWGKCRPNEVKVPLTSVTTRPPRGLDGGPFRLVLNGGTPYACTWTAKTTTLACVTPPPSPTPSPSTS